MHIPFLLTLFPASVAFSLIPDVSYTFEQFVSDFGRDYHPRSEQYLRRKSIFEDRLKEVLAHNNDKSKSWHRGINEFSDFTVEEFKTSGRLGLDRSLARHYSSKVGAVAPAPNRSSESLPVSWDWREKGIISNVKDQGSCGSCWAFATTAVIESHAALSSGLLEVLSPQQLVSCAENPLQCGGTGGCQGSIPEVAYQYIQLYGMTTEWKVPYTSYFGTSDACSFNASRTPAVVEISGYQKLPVNDYEAVMDALVNIGPLAVNVQANTWSDYHGGVYDGCSNWSNVEIDHVVVLVGYGTDPKHGDYWLIRNSWDATWGEKGFIRLKRSSKPECGTDLHPSEGTGCSGGPATQHVCGQCGLLFDVSYPLGVKIAGKGHVKDTIYT